MARPPKRPRGIDVHRGRWRYRFKLPGHERVTEQTGLEATSQNLSVVSDLMSAHKRRVILGEPEPIKDVRFSDAANHFEKAKEAECRDKPDTARRVKTSLASYRVYFPEKMLIRDVTKADVEDYMTWRRLRAIKEVTLRKDVLTLPMLVRHAIDRRWIESDPTQGIEMPSDEDSINTRIITDRKSGPISRWPTLARAWATSPESYSGKV